MTDGADDAWVVLDIDGVLGHGTLYDAHRASGRRWPLASDWIDRACVRRLDRLCAAAAARVVISSSWRSYEVIPGASRGRWEGTAEVLRACGLTADVAGATPDHRSEAMKRRQRFAPRWPEIREWLRANPSARRWVVIDDCEVPGVPEGRMVRTDFRVGLTDADVDLAAAILARG